MRFGEVHVIKRHLINVISLVIPFSDLSDKWSYFSLYYVAIFLLVAQDFSSSNNEKVVDTIS
jgi:hypothetical protein